VFCERIGNVKRTYRYFFVDYILQKNMSVPDGLISCKGFAYNNRNINASNGNNFIRLGTISGVTGSHIKIECLLGNSNAQGTTPVQETIPLPNNGGNAPILLTIYSSFHDNAQQNNFCNLEGFYTVVGNATSILGVFVEYTDNHYSYNVYLQVDLFDNNLNYFIYLPSNCTWVNDGTSYSGFLYNEPSHYYRYQKL
jgi:hypothetical protein